ncbi:MAG TPA: gliding motility protein RemB [Flavobacteriaceae bacterium]|nr:gliding motility protein RemB [Flavobacteriaceae bacterium]MCB9212282.1 gliding motility protein RemB [Alteromonas sp.]HPF10339.1 gliding motility protein RemB [Flavobacteriaceae bacterium]HQU20403.1 gliding motility protein RemB [Flavobacteriaceae bacterium]HQU65741.1 gliding motility protein RemB [Flavobacteriaceae bacterium]
MKHLCFLVLFFLSSVVLVHAQIDGELTTKYPVFPSCEPVNMEMLPSCFNNAIREILHENFQTPEIAKTENYSGEVRVLFEVDENGTFHVLYTDSVYEEVKDEVKRVFKMIPKIKPASYNGKPTHAQFTISFMIPLGALKLESTNSVERFDLESNNTMEYDNLESLPYENDVYKSALNIPLSHHNYSLFDAYLNQVGTNTHTAQKPFLYSDVDSYYHFEARNKAISKTRSTWLGRKWWNEHMVTLKGKDYWITLDPGVDLQIGKDDQVNTYNNTRLVYTQGAIGKQINFFAVVYESQGRFADYFNRYAESIKPDGGNPAIIPARGIAKKFKEDSYDYPIATGYVSYTPSTHFNIQLGHGKNFIGDGYRSLFMSDNASPYPYFKLNTTFWKIKYTNTWMSLRDVRSEVTDNGSFRTKYMANHYLSYNVTKRWNLGLFESVIWENDNDRGFDFNYLNPIIFYRAIEFSTGSRGGNALIGLSSKFKFTDRVNAYGQLIIDEFSSSDIFGGKGSYKNKIGYQLGAKYYNAFGVDQLFLQAEYNHVRPYTYSHNTIVLNYGHNNQSLAHTLGANFSEWIAIARYQRGRIFGDLKLVFAKRGFEFNTEEDSFFYGGDIYGTEDNRVSDDGNDLAQGNTTDFFHGEFQAGYLINPATNLKVYASLIYRDFKPILNTATVFENQTTWFNFGIRTDLFNWYYDF